MAHTSLRFVEIFSSSSWSGTTPQSQTVDLTTGGPWFAIGYRYYLDSDNALNGGWTFDTVFTDGTSDWDLVTTGNAEAFIEEISGSTGAFEIWKEVYFRDNADPGDAIWLKGQYKTTVTPITQSNLGDTVTIQLILKTEYE
jgi:hypothetical protein